MCKSDVLELLVSIDVSLLHKIQAIRPMFN